MTQKKEFFGGDVAVVITFSLGGKRREADTDAFNKQILDALEHAGVYKNDNQVKFMSVLNAGGDKEAHVDVFQIFVMDLASPVELSKTISVDAASSAE